MGQKKIEMHFLPDVWVECDTCRGRRYNPETLAVQYRGKSISDVLNLRIKRSSSRNCFGNIPKIRNVLQTLADVGLGYMARVGQPAPDDVRRREPEFARETAPRNSPAPAPARRCTCSTNRRRDCTSTTSTSCSKCCNDLTSISVTRSSWSSTTSTSWGNGRRTG